MTDHPKIFHLIYALAIILALCSFVSAHEAWTGIIQRKIERRFGSLSGDEARAKGFQMVGWSVALGCATAGCIAIGKKLEREHEH